MAASAKLKSRKEYMVLALESVDQLEAHGSRLVAIFSKETPSA
jgi:hypothetical protein